MATKSSILKQIKRDANQLKNETGLQYTAALDIVSQKNGFQNWQHAKKQAGQDNPGQYLALKTSYPLRFYMGRQKSAWDATDKTDSNYVEDLDFSKAVFAFGKKSGSSDTLVYHILTVYIFLRHKFAKPNSVYDAVTLITEDFRCPPYSIWLYGIEYYSATDLNNPKAEFWRGQSVINLFKRHEG